MTTPERKLRRLRHEPERRETLRERLDRYFDLPLAIASILLVLLTIIELTGEVRPPWSKWMTGLIWGLWSLFLLQFLAALALAPRKRQYLRHHWLDALAVLIPVLRIFSALRILRATRALPLTRLLIFGGRGSSGAIALLRRRRLGQLALISGLVILIGAAGAFLLENTAPESTIRTFGDALWWSATTVTTVASELYPVTTGGRILGFALMVYAMAVFTYFTASIASVLIDVDARNPPEEEEIPGPHE